MATKSTKKVSSEKYYAVTYSDEMGSDSILLVNEDLETLKEELVEFNTDNDEGDKTEYSIYTMEIIDTVRVSRAVVSS